MSILLLMIWYNEIHCLPRPCSTQTVYGQIPRHIYQCHFFRVYLAEDNFLSREVNEVVSCCITWSMIMQTMWKFQRWNTDYVFKSKRHHISCFQKQAEDVYCEYFTTKILQKSLYREKMNLPVTMMTSSNGSIFHVTGPCEGNSPVTGEFPS